MRFFKPKPSDDEMDEELRAHLEMRVERNLAEGMSPAQARRVAQQQFGWIESLKEDCRDARGGRWLADLLADLRYATRTLIKRPGFAIVVIATLALGAGANTAVFSLINATLLRPLPFREPDRLVWIHNPETASPGAPGMTRSVTVREWRERGHSFERLGCYIAWFGRQQTVLTLNGEASRVEGLFIDGEFLQTLGVRPMLGRAFDSDDTLDSVILSHRFWKTRFNSDPAIVGKAITISGRPWNVVGVLPATFDFSSVFMPGPKPIDFLRSAPHFGDLSDNSHAVIGRLKPGVTLQQAQAELDGLNAQIRAANPERGQFGAQLVSLRQQISGSFRLPLTVLACAVGCVLLIACANLSNLMLARAASRRHEWAIRLSLGAGRGRLLRQMLAESALLSCAGAVAGVAVARVLTDAIVHSHVFFVPLLNTAHIDRAALAFTLLVTCASALILGIIPALQLPTLAVQTDLKEGARNLSDGKSGSTLRSVLIVSEMAMACALLAGAALLIRSFVHLARVDLGFRPEFTVACRVRTNRNFKTNTEAVVYFTELSRRIEALPGVQAVGFTRALPLGAREIVNVSARAGNDSTGQMPSVFIQDADQGYFKTLGIPLIAGRTFNDHDVIFDGISTALAPPGVIVNEKMARDFWPGQSAVGQSVFVHENGNTSSLITECKVVGVVANVRQNPMELNPAPQIYFFNAGGNLLVRTRGDVLSLAASIRETLRQNGSDILLEDFRSFDQMLDEIVSPRRLIMYLAAAFAGLALLLAVVGIYGVIAYSVSRRTHEIGIRLALGASRASVIQLVVAHGLRLALVGCAIGLVGALALSRFAQAMLFGVSGADPISFSAAALLLLLSALGASWLPAAKATRLDLISALRQD